MKAKQLPKKSITNKVMKHTSISLLMALFSLMLYSVLALFFAGCATKEYAEVIKTVEVKTPIECNITAPTLAPLSGGGESTQENRLNNEINIYIYAEDLENTLKACKGHK